MRGIDIFQNPYYREISTMRGRTMRGLSVTAFIFAIFKNTQDHVYYHYLSSKLKNLNPFFTLAAVEQFPSIFRVI